MTSNSHRGESVPSIIVTIDHGGSIIDALGAMEAMYLRMNEARGTRSQRRARPIRLTLESDIPELTDRQRQLLRKADQTAYLQGPQFQSPQEVASFFTRENLNAISPGVLTEMDNVALSEMAMAVISARRHCNF